MKITFNEVTKIVSERYQKFRVEKEKNKFIFINSENNYIVEYTFDETLNEKITSKIKNAHLIYRVKIIIEKSLFRDTFQLIVKNKESLIRIDCTLLNNQEVQEPNIFTGILDKHYMRVRDANDSQENLKDEIESLVETLKNINEYRLHYLFS